MRRQHQKFTTKLRARRQEGFVSVIALFYTGAAEEDALAAHAGAHLARYKQPRLYLRRAAIPVTANGKVNRRSLREEWKATR